MRVGISVLAFLVAFVALRQFAPGGVLFYQGVALACLAALVHWLVARRARPPARSPVKDVLLVLLASYAFMFTVPTTVDRSYSVRMLRHLQQIPDGATRAELQDYFAQDFVRQGGVDRRLLEQERTGSILESDGRVRLTTFGRVLATSFEVACIVFACRDPSP